jgi:hypothetical protein
VEAFVVNIKDAAKPGDQLHAQAALTDDVHCSGSGSSSIARLLQRQRWTASHW